MSTLTGLLASASSYWPRLPVTRFERQWPFAAVVNGYSCGAAPELHRLPDIRGQTRGIRVTNTASVSTSSSPEYKNNTG